MFSAEITLASRIARYFNRRISYANTNMEARLQEYHFSLDRWTVSLNCSGRGYDQGRVKLSGYKGRVNQDEVRALVTV